MMKAAEIRPWRPFIYNRGALMLTAVAGLSQRAMVLSVSSLGLANAVHTCLLDTWTSGVTFGIAEAHLRLALYSCHRAPHGHLIQNQSLIKMIAQIHFFEGTGLYSA